MKGYPDTRIELYKDSEALELLAPLIVADANRFWEGHDIDFDGKYRKYNSLLSLRGHIANNHIKASVDYLFDNLALLSSHYKVRLPREVNDKEEFMNHYKGPYANITVYDIASILHNHDLLEETPEEVFLRVELMKSDVKQFLIDLAQGNSRHYLVNQKGEPFFGLNVLRDFYLDDLNAFMVSVAWSLGVMDSAYYRARTGLNLGEGINCAVDLENMMAMAGTSMGFDIKSLSEFDTAEYLGLLPDTPSEVVLDKFHEKMWPVFVKYGISFDNVQRQSHRITDGYIRVSKGNSPDPNERKKYGTADSMSNMYGGLVFGKSGWAGIVIGDSWDTAEGLSKRIYKGGHDSKLFDELMQYPRFRKVVEPYLAEEFTNKLIKWGSEVPPHEVTNVKFIPPSCSQRYLNEVYYVKDRDPFTTLELQLSVLDHIQQFLASSGVPKEIPNYPMGFEQISSKQFWQNFYQKTHRYLANGIFPKNSWVYNQLKC